MNKPIKTNSDQPQVFVKFFGSSADRASRKLPVLDELKRSGNHFACTYPRGKRPRGVKDGAIMLMGRLVSDPDDILIYGRAIGTKHDPLKDDASAEEIALRPWKTRWPHYIRVDSADFIDGTLADGISLFELMSALGWKAFASTARNQEQEKGNTNPRMSIRRQAAVELSADGADWVVRRLTEAFAKCGIVPRSSFEHVE